MSNILQQLRDVANKAMQSQNIEEGMKYLAKAFALFSQETESLKISYDKLQERFQMVNEELENNHLELKKKIRELNILNSYLNFILKNISHGIIFIDQEGSITTFNKEAEKIFQMAEKEILCKKYDQFFSDTFFGFSIKNSLNKKESSTLETISLENNKQIEISASYMDVKEYQGLIILIKDVTEIQKLQVIANRNDRMKQLGEMAATVAHEIKNPLGGIRGYASLLFRDLENSKHLQEMAGYIIDGTKTLERLLNNVLHFTRPLDLKFEIIDLTILLKEICNFIKVDPTYSKEILFETHIPQDEILVKIDRDLFRSAMLNLIVNAYQAIPSKGKVILSLIKNGYSCMITVSDNGVGIDPKDMENIFTPFFTTKKGGNGLGLSESYKIIQAHMGYIDVRSKLNFGTTFTIQLPLKEIHANK